MMKKSKLLFTLQLLLILQQKFQNLSKISFSQRAKKIERTFEGALQICFYLQRKFLIDFILERFESMNHGRCAACKNQRRRCPPDCIFSPYFPANDPQRFECVHKIYGGSNVGKMLQVINQKTRSITDFQRITCNLLVFFFSFLFNRENIVMRKSK